MERKEVRQMTLDKERAKINRQIIAGDIDRHQLGRKLTPQARKRAIDFALESWKGDMGAGTAVENGIRHVTSDVLKPE